MTPETITAIKKARAMNVTTLTCTECGNTISYGEEIQHHDTWYRGFYDTAWKKFVTQEKEK